MDHTRVEGTKATYPHRSVCRWICSRRVASIDSHSVCLLRNSSSASFAATSSADTAAVASADTTPVDDDDSDDDDGDDDDDNDDDDDDADEDADPTGVEETAVALTSPPVAGEAVGCKRA